MIFSVLAFVALILSICIKDRNKSLFVQSLNCLFEAIYDFIINAFTGAVLSIINVIRTSIFRQSDKINRKLYVLLLYMFESIIVINCIYTWNGFISFYFPRKSNNPAVNFIDADDLKLLTYLSN